MNGLNLYSTKSHQRKFDRPQLKYSRLYLTIAIALSGCTTLARHDHPPATAQSIVPVGFSPSVRSQGIDWRLERSPEEIIKGLRAAVTDGSLDVLALSGGGASGAFGAGALVGLSKAHTRPQFELVTGVSTGALIAPFAFLGPAWDPQLTEAFVGGLSSGLMQRRGLKVLFNASVFEGEPLKKLIDTFVTQALVNEVASEAKKGRLLLVATTDLDKSETVVWNMGVIAAKGDESARLLFRDVLIASASVPGIFPPVMVPVSDSTGATYDEMHVDGTTTVPFFIAPEAILVAPGLPWEAQGGNIYIVINSELNVLPSSTPVNTLAIFERGFSSALAHTSRTALAQNANFAQKLGMTFHYTAIPSNDGFAGFLDFDASKMKSLFEYGSRCAANGQLWLSKMQQTLDQATNPIEPAGPLAPECPVASAATAKQAK